MRILTNCFFARYRKRKRAPQMIGLEDAEPIFIARQVMANGLIPDPEDPAALVLGKLGEEEVSGAIAALPEEFRVVCALYFVEEASYEEIAAMVACPVGTVRSRLHRGRRLLQKALWHLAQEHGVTPKAMAGQEAT
jgi:RNA polymerase sigma-70 factor (ECF subfamily)